MSMNSESARLRYRQVRFAEDFARRTELTRSELDAAVDSCIAYFRADLNDQFHHRVASKQHASSPSRFPPLDGYRDEWRQLEQLNQRGVARVANAHAALNAPEARDRIGDAVRFEIAFGTTVWTFLWDVATDAGYEQIVKLATLKWGASWRSHLPRIIEG